MSFLGGLFGGRNRADATISVNAKTDNAQRNLSKLEKTIKTVVSAVIIKKIARYGIALAKLGAQAEMVAKNFDNFAKKNAMASTKMMADMRKATKGMMSDIELQQNAMKAMISGVAYDDMVTAMEYVTNYAAATGADVSQKLMTVMTGFARGSAQFLDDVGIQVMGAEDVVGAAVDQMKEKMQDFATSEEDAAVEAANLEAAIKNLGAELGQSLGPALEGVVDIAENAMPTLKKLANEFGGFIGAISGKEYSVEDAAIRGREGLEKLLEVERQQIQTEKMITILQERKTKEGRLGAKNEALLNSLIARRIELRKEERKALGLAATREAGLEAAMDRLAAENKGEKPDDSSGKDKSKAEKIAKETMKRRIELAEYEYEKQRSIDKQTMDRRIELAEMEYEQEREKEERKRELRKQYAQLNMSDIDIWYTEQLNALEEKFDGIADMEEEKLALREQINKEYNERIADNAIREAERAAREQEQVRNKFFSAMSVSSNAFANFEIATLKRTAKSQEEYDKKMAEIQKAAANRQYAIALFQKTIALSEALVSLGSAAAKSAEQGASYGGAYGAIAEAVLAGAELAFIISEISAVNVPEPKFRMGRMGKRNRGGFGDIEPAMIDPAETIVPAAQSAIYRDELQAIVNNTAGLRSMSRGGGNTYVYQGVSTEQLLQATVATERRNATGRRL